MITKRFVAFVRLNLLHANTQERGFTVHRQFHVHCRGIQLPRMRPPLSVDGSHARPSGLEFRWTLSQPLPKRAPNSKNLRIYPGDRQRNEVPIPLPRRRRPLQTTYPRPLQLPLPPPLLPLPRRRLRLLLVLLRPRLRLRQPLQPIACLISLLKALPLSVFRSALLCRKACDGKFRPANRTHQLSGLAWTGPQHKI